MKKARRAETLRHFVNRLLNDCEISDAPVPVEEIAEHLRAEVRYSPFDGELAGMLVRSDDGDTVIGVNSAHHIKTPAFHYRTRMRASCFA